MCRVKALKLAEVGLHVRPPVRAPGQLPSIISEVGVDFPELQLPFPTSGCFTVELSNSPGISHRDRQNVVFPRAHTPLPVVVLAAIGNGVDPRHEGHVDPCSHSEHR
jgi:hypothetical protein